MTYRAAIYRHPSTGQETALTGPEHAHLPRAELVEEAVAEARRADLIGDEYPRVTEDELRSRLYIGQWSDRAAR